MLITSVYCTFFLLLNPKCTLVYGFFVACPGIYCIPVKYINIVHVYTVHIALKINIYSVHLANVNRNQ